MKQATAWTVAGGGGGGSFTDGRQTWTLNNPRSVEAAIDWARASAGSNSSAEWYNRCLAYTAIVYSWNVSGVPYAIDHFSVVPKAMQHAGDRNPPPGALMYWDTGSRAGHIAVYLGNGQIVSNDILRRARTPATPARLASAQRAAPTAAAPWQRPPWHVRMLTVSAGHGAQSHDLQTEGTVRGEGGAGVRSHRSRLRSAAEADRSPPQRRR
ncbi:hypothetical protein [Streptomyces triculaminicus]|uniref:hypothetical protein n=1 Tax=Streptomyces triculaminicus TaxID=2816232 RepID=UPI003787719F